MSDVDNLYHRLVLGAGESIDILSTPIWQRHAEHRDVPHIFQVVPEADRRLRLRHIYLLPNKYDEANISNTLQLFRVMGFAARLLFGHSRRDYFLVDGRDAIVCDYKQNTPALSHYGPEAAHILSSLRNHFDNLWSLADNKEERKTVLYDRELDIVLPDYSARVISIANKEWEPIIRQFAADPNLLYSMSPHQFEELVAELFRREGYEVSLTSISRDGGKDILVSTNKSSGDHIYLVECKRYSSQKKVGVSVVREVYGTVSQFNATAGIIVTTSYFTRDALSFREPVKWRMSLKDYECLSDWLTNVQRKL